MTASNVGNCATARRQTIPLAHVLCVSWSLIHRMCSTCTASRRLEFGPKDLEAVEHVQIAMSETHNREVTKTELVRAAIEFLVKDYNAHREQSLIVRTFVRR